MKTQAADAWADHSRFAVVDLTDQGSVSSEGRVRYLLIHGELDRGGAGLVGAIWISADGERGGFIHGSGAEWTAAEMARSHQSALDRGWSHERIFRYWSEDPGERGSRRGGRAEAESLRKLVHLVQTA